MPSFVVVRDDHDKVFAARVPSGFSGFLFGIFILPFKGLWLQFCLLLPLWIILFFVEIVAKQFPPSTTRLVIVLFLTLIQAAVYFAPIFWGKNWMISRYSKKGYVVEGAFDAPSEEKACEIALGGLTMNQDKASSAIRKSMAKSSQNFSERIEPK